MDYEIDYRTAEELREPSYRGLNDIYGILRLTPEKRLAFIENPFRRYWDVYSQQVVSSNGLAFACHLDFPLRYRTPDGVITVVAGSTTFVAEEYRKSEVGLMFAEWTRKMAPDLCTVGASMSQIMMRLMRIRKANVFEQPRHILLFKSRSVVEMFIKNTLFSKILSGCINVVLSVVYRIVGLIVAARCRGYVFRDVESTDEPMLNKVAELIASDSRPFAEVHDVAWLKWMMTHAFEDSGGLSLAVVEKEGELLAFYMTKRRFHKQASSRGFKNVWLGSIMEWQARPEMEHMMPTFLLRAALRMRGRVDACEIITDDLKIVGAFRKCLAQHVGDGNCRFDPPKSHPIRSNQEYRNRENWRLRPAWGDAGLN